MVHLVIAQTLSSRMIESVTASGRGVERFSIGVVIASVLAAAAISGVGL